MEEIILMRKKRRRKAFPKKYSIQQANYEILGIEEVKTTIYSQKNGELSKADKIKMGDSIKNNGFNEPIILDDSNNVFQGFKRLECAKYLGMMKIPIVRLKNISAGMRKNGFKDSICSNCGMEYTARKNGSSLFCSSCRAQKSGSASSHKIRVARKPCPTCGKPIRVTSGNNYCSHECRMKVTNIKRICKLCGSEFVLCQSVLSGKTNSSGNFCSKFCYWRWMEKQDSIAGRGSRWASIRREMIRQNPFCGICGNMDEKLEVHHIIPYNLTYDNRKTNLIPLCHDCHIAIAHLTKKIMKKDCDLKSTKEYLGKIFSRFKDISMRRMAALSHA